MRQFSGYGLKRALMAGIHRVIERRDEINRINVFPVPDGDTGTNLAFTLASVLQAVKPLRLAHAGRVMDAAAQEAIDGARGNSGAILAQFFQGVSESLIGNRRVNLERLSAAVNQGVRSAYEALAQPKEGTILSVATAFGKSLSSDVQTGERDVRASYARALQAAKTALSKTPEQLAVLRDAGVVDAGAAGFVDLLEGIDAFINNGELGPVRDTELLTASVEAAGSADAPPDEHRYCTECVISAADIDRKALREALETLPISSLVCAGTRAKVRVHAHVDEPGRMFEICARFGAVSSQKADDTHAQAEAAHSKHDRVAIVIDSGADVPDELLEQLHIHMVPVRLNISGHDYLDKVSITSADFFAAMRRGEVPRTSQPPMGDFRRTFEFLRSHHDELVYVGLARSLSGTLQAAESAAQKAGRPGIHCVDTFHASVAQGLLAIDAARAADLGWNAERILARIESMRLHTRLECLVRDIRYGVRGGRAPKLAGPLCTLLHAKPLAGNRPDGRLGVRGFIWGEKRLAERFAARLSKILVAGKRHRILIAHCDSESDAHRLRDALLQLRQDAIEESWVVPMGTAVGSHAGPGSLAVGVQECIPLA